MAGGKASFAATGQRKSL